MVAEDRRYRIGAAPSVHRRPGRVEEPAGDDQQPQLERPEVVDAELDAYRAKLEAIAHAQRAGHLINGLDPIDLLILVLALTTAAVPQAAATGAGRPRGPA